MQLQRVAWMPSHLHVDAVRDADLPPLEAVAAVGHGRPHNDSVLGMHLRHQPQRL